MITVHVTIDGKDQVIRYSDPVAMIFDSGLKAAFDSGIVNSCKIFIDNTRIAGLGVCEWGRFREAINNNAVALIRSVKTNL